MEGEGERLPREEGAKKPMTKIIVAVVVIIVIIAAIGAALLLMGGQEPANKVPTAVATANVSVITAGESVTFSAAGSADQDGQITNYTWNFGDGTAQDTGNVSSVTHQYDYPGIYLIALTVKDDDGATTTNWQTLVRVEVLNPAPPEAPDNDTIPYAIAATSGAIIQNNTKVDFNAASSMAYGMIYDESEEAWTLDFSADQIDELTWTFGDGSAAAVGALVNHTYQGPGTLYASYVTVESLHGATQRYDNTIAVLPLTGVTPGGVKNPDIFVEATIGEPESIDPGYNYESAGGEVLQNIYETLVWYDREKADVLKPMLATEVPTAENGGISDDGLEYTFHLRSGVKFHDGTIMDAYDVEYSFERVLLMNNEHGPAWMMGQVMVPDYGAGLLDPDDIDASVEVVDSLTVKIHLVVPYPAFINVLAYTVGSVMSMEWAEANGGVTAGELNEFILRNEMGTGPFKLKEWASNQYILLERFDDYWGGQAAVKYAVIKKVEDIGTREMMLFSGDADVIYVPINHKFDVIGKPNVRIVQGLPTFDMAFIGYNQNIAPGPLDIGTVPLDFFADPNVRKAFNYAFDYQTYIEDVLYNASIVPNGPIPKGMLGYNDTVPTYYQNLTLAAEYLSLAINEDTGNSWADDGFTIYLYYNSGNLVRETACLLFKENLESLTDDGYVAGNIVVNVQALDWSGAYLPALYGRQLPIFYLGWGPDFADPDDYANPFLHENGTYPARCSIQNHTLTLMVEQAAKELDPEVRKQMYYDISMSCYENAYYLWLSQPTNFHVERTWVTGWYFNPMYSGLYFYVLGKA